ncbi:MAG: hypothetical protein AB8B55_00210 [Mariniblastus sp.]
MNPKFPQPLLALTILLASTIATANAQSGNPLRFGQLGGAPQQTNTQPQEQSHSRASSQSPGQASAQIQLQTQTKQRTTPDRQIPTNMPPEVLDAIYPPKRDPNSSGKQGRRIPKLNANQTQPQTQNQTQPQRTRPAFHPPHSSVSQASYSTATDAQNNIKPVSDMLGQLQHQVTQNQTQPFQTNQILRPNDLKKPATTEGSQDDSAQKESHKFQKLIQKIALSTCMVLAMGVGFIFVAKQWMQHKSPTRRSPPEDSIKITSTLKLSPKSSLFLVETGKQKLIVASDQNGIKSMVALNRQGSIENSFASTLDSLSEAALTTEPPSGSPHEAIHAAIKEAAKQTNVAKSPRTSKTLHATDTTGAPELIRAADLTRAAELARSAELAQAAELQDNAGRHDKHDDVSASAPDVYSLGSVGGSKTLQPRAHANTETTTNTTQKTLDQESFESIRRQMEEALKENGIKDLFLKSLRDTESLSQVN